jgi:hypothetical protein
MSSTEDSVVLGSRGGGSATFMATYRCDHCRRLSIGWSVGPGDIDTRGNGAYGWLEIAPNINWIPQVGVSKAFPDVPDHIAGAASEAHECQSIGALRAAVLLARSVIEATAKDRGITNGNLAAKIDAMCDQGMIRQHVRDEAHEVRHLGNDMAHGDFVEPVDPDDAEAVLVLMGEVLEEVYQSPAKVARLQAKREAKRPS